MARFWRRRPTTATRTTEEQVERVPPPPPRPFWPWLVLLLLLVLGALAASWYFATRDETVDATTVPDVVGLQRDDAERRLEGRDLEREVKAVDSRQPAGEVIAQRPNPGTRYGEGGIVVISVARSPSEVEVPDLVGLRTQVALTRLRTAGLNPRAQAVQSRRPKGIVLRQVPSAGTEVPKGSAAVVVVSAGPQLADVPDVVGLSTDAATAQLTKAGFRTQVQRVPSGMPEGTVVAQSPGGGSRAQRGRVVRINASRGETETTTTVVTTTTTPARATIPDTVGQDEGTARSTIEGAGFQVRVVDRTVMDPSQEGIVVRQTPAGGGSAAPGSTVTITVGRLR
jgi:beta-lactam-binding protein with PASTA domain